MAMEGFSDLHTREDLLHKLEREHARLLQDPRNVDYAWNFFVTAEHLPDWLSRGGKEPLPTGETPGAFKVAHLLTRICAHLATGGKHFSPYDFHKSVVGITHDGVFEDGIFEPGIYEVWLGVQLAPDEARALEWQERLQLQTDTIDVRALAGLVLAFWQQYLREHPTP